MDEPKPTMLDETQKHLAVWIAKHSDDNVLAVIKEWTKELMDIQAQNLSKKQKFKLVTNTTVARVKELKPTLDKIAVAIKKHTWDERSIAARWTFGGFGLAVATLGTQSFGLAGFGTAVAVSSAVVFGAAGALIGVLHQEASRELEKRNRPTTTYTKSDGTVIEAKEADSD